jgi:glucokinase
MAGDRQDLAPVWAMLGVDVGGTKATAGPVDTRGRLLAEPLTQPSRTNDQDVFMDGLAATVTAAVQRFEGMSAGVGGAPIRLRGVGLACAGTVDPIQGVVVTSPNLPLVDAPLCELLQNAVDRPVSLENDATAAALAEAVTGAGAGLKHVVMVTLGTGVGGGLFLEGRPYRGAGGGAGELGHVVIVAGGELCHCGNHGCWEAYASGTALARHGARRAGDPDLDSDGALAQLMSEGRLDGVAVSKLAQRGHPGARAAVGELGYWVGIGLIGLVNTFNPEMIVVGGGVSELGEMILGPAREVARVALPPNRDQVRIVTAALGPSAGLIGGGLVAWELLGGS